MTSSEPAAAGRACAAVQEPPGSLAEDAPELQHPVLRRLQRGGPVGAGVRRGAAWAAGGKAAGQFIQFLGTIATARLLTPDDYGKTAIIIPLTAFAAIFTSLGLGSAVIHDRRVTEKLLSTAFWVNAVTGVLLTGLVCALAVPLAHLFRVPLLAPLLVLASLNFTLNLNIVHTALLERTLRFKQIALLEMTCSVLSIGTVVVTAVYGFGPFSLVLGPLSYTIARTALSWWAVPWAPRARPDRESIRELWRFTRGITGFNVLIFWSRNADNLLLARYASQTDLGNYSRAYNLMKLPVGQMQVVMGRVLFPALTRLRDDRPRLARAWLRALSVAGLATAPIAIGMAVAAPAMVEVLFGRRWLGMVTVLELLAVSALPQTLTATVGGLLRATGATDELFRLGMLISSLSLVAMLIGLPWGTVGVATALMVKFYLEVLIFARPCLRETGLSWRDLVVALSGVWASCLALGGAGLAVRLTLAGHVPAWQVLLAQIAACTVAYVASLALVSRPTLLAVVELVRTRGHHGTRPGAGARVETAPVGSASAESASVGSASAESAAAGRPVPGPGAAGVWGWVTSSDGSALAGAALTLTDLSGRQLARGRSADDGSYRLVPASGGPVLLICAAEPYQPAAAMVELGGTGVHRDVALAARTVSVGG